jgi:hypothetical protein
LEEAGSTSGDSLYELAQSEAAMSDTYGPAVHQVGSAGGDLAWAAHEKAVEVVDQDIPTLKAAVREKVTEVKAAVAEIRTEVIDKAEGADKWQRLKQGAASYLPW